MISSDNQGSNELEVASSGLKHTSTLQLSAKVLRLVTLAHEEVIYPSYRLRSAGPAAIGGGK